MFVFHYFDSQEPIKILAIKPSISTKKAIKPISFKALKLVNMYIPKNIITTIEITCKIFILKTFDC